MGIELVQGGRVFVKNWAKIKVNGGNWLLFVKFYKKRRIFSFAISQYGTRVPVKHDRVRKKKKKKRQIGKENVELFFWKWKVCLYNNSYGTLYNYYNIKLV